MTKPEPRLSEGDLVFRMRGWISKLRREGSGTVYKWITDDAEKYVNEVEAALRAPRKEQGEVIVWQYHSSYDGSLQLMPDKMFREHYAERHPEAIALVAASPNGGPEERDGWQDISTAPKDGRMILAFNVAHKQTAVVGWHPPGFPHDEGHWSDVGARIASPALHFNSGFFQYWRPLPPPPALASHGQDKPDAGAQD